MEEAEIKRILESMNVEEKIVLSTLGLSQAQSQITQLLEKLSKANKEADNLSKSVLELWLQKIKKKEN